DLKSSKRKKVSKEETITLLKRDEIAVGGTALIYLKTYSNGTSEVEKRLSPRFQGQRDYEALNQREYSILSKLNHFFIVKPLRLVTEPSVIFEETTEVLYLESVPGIDLSQFLPILETYSKERRKKFTLTLAQQLFSVATYLRGEGVVHGDLSPENILL